MLPAIQQANTIAPMSAGYLAQVGTLQDLILQAPQIDIVTEHVFHGGMYSRTIKLPADCVLVGALIKIPTTLVVSGDVVIHTEDGPLEIKGHAVIPAFSGTKRVIRSISDATLTMTFPTQAKTVAEAELEFTDEVDALMSHHNQNVVIVTGE